MLNLGWIKTVVQIENRYKTVIKSKKNSMKNNRTSGSSRITVEYSTELENISRMDDSLEPEFVIGVGESQKNKSPTKIEPKRPEKRSIASVLLKIHEEREKNREIRLQKKFNLIRELFPKEKEGPN